MHGSSEDADFAVIAPGDRPAAVGRLCDAMLAIEESGRYPHLTVGRPWSAHRPVLDGEVSGSGTLRWFFGRELARLAAAGARVRVRPGRRAAALTDTVLPGAIDETGRDLRGSRLFLYGPERAAWSMDRLAHYTGTPAAAFQRHVLLVNYPANAGEFCAMTADVTGPDCGSRQMPAWHQVMPGQQGITVICIGVGPSNAKTITDHLAVLRPDLILMAGHCAGLRNQQDIGDLVLAGAYLRDDRVLDDVLPAAVPVTSSQVLNAVLADEIASRGLRAREGTVYSTADRNWEMRLAQVEERLRLSRAVAVDMESGTVAANAYRYKVPAAALLVVSDKPLHGRPKLNGAISWIAATARLHMEIAVAAAETVRKLYPDGIAAASGSYRATAAT